MVDGEKVFVLSNDVVPGLAMPVAAPGLRAFGLAEGLRANGFRVKTLVPRGLVERRWPLFGRSVPHPTAPQTDVVDARSLAGYLRANAPATAVLVNGNQADHLQPIDGVRYVMDFFAPKMLEELYHHGADYPGEALANIRRRKLRAIQLADAFIVNGRKKVPYFLAWLLQADKDARRVPLEVVNMCVPLASGAPGGRSGGVRFAVAGYLQSWSTLGNWVGAVERWLDHPGMSLALLVPWHWGGGHGIRPHASTGDLDRLARHPSVSTHGTMNYAEFLRFLSGVDVSIDLFEHNLEREYAMVTRSVVSLACGVPVVHPPFTEVSPMIEAYDAGWLVDPYDAGAVDSVIAAVLENPEIVRKKKENARRLAAELLDPEVAVKPLVRILRSR